MFFDNRTRRQEQVTGSKRIDSMTSFSFNGLRKFSQLSVKIEPKVVSRSVTAIRKNRKTLPEVSPSSSCLLDLLLSSFREEIKVTKCWEETPNVSGETKAFFFFFFVLFFFFVSGPHDPWKSPRAIPSRIFRRTRSRDYWKVRSQRKNNSLETKRNTRATMGCRGREAEEETRPCSYAPVDSRNIFARLTEPLSRRLLVRPSDVGARLLSDLLLAPAFAFFRGGARRPRSILPGRSSSYR